MGIWVRYLLQTSVGHQLTDSGGIEGLTSLSRILSQSILWAAALSLLRHLIFEPKLVSYEVAPVWAGIGESIGGYKGVCGSLMALWKFAIASCQQFFPTSSRGPFVRRLFAFSSERAHILRGDNSEETGNGASAEKAWFFSTSAQYYGILCPSLLRKRTTLSDEGCWIDSKQKPAIVRSFSNIRRPIFCFCFQSQSWCFCNVYWCAVFNK